MNKSIILRSALVIAVIVMWGVSIFPYQDRDFETVLRQQVAERKTDDADMAKFDAAIARSKELVAEANEHRAADTWDPEIHPPANLPEALVQVAERDPDFQLRDYVPLNRNAEASDREVVQAVQTIARGRIRLGTDLRGGTEFVIAFDPADLSSDDNEIKVRDQIIEILRNRLDASGTLGADIRPTGDNRVSVLIPATDPADVAAFRKILERPAQLEFRRVFEGQVRPGAEPPIGFIELPQQISEDGIRSEGVIWVKDTPELLTGEYVDDAFAQRGQFGEWQVVLRFNSAGATMFGEITASMIDKPLAIVLDGKVMSAPVIRAQIFSTAEISGNFTEKESKELAATLRSGNLPVPIKVEGTNTTAPTLGHATVTAGVYAALGGLAVVVIFMIIYYRLSGVIAVIALAINAIIVLGTMPILDAALTLPGIAGMILTIGMAVDANVLIFERIREESENGKNIITAVRNGYDKVFSTILDANLTTLFTAFFLYKFGSGPIKGFAVTLSIGIIASMFTALFVTRLIYDFLLEKNLMKKAGMMAFFTNLNFDFVSKSRAALIGSAVLVIVSLGILGIRGSSAYSIDFTGGAQLQYTYAEQAPIDELSTFLQENGYKGASVAYKGALVAEASTVEILLRPESLPEDDPATNNVNEREVAVTSVQTLLDNAFPALELGNGQVNEVGSLVGDAFRKQAVMAMLLSILAMIVYISFRFEFGYAIGAVTCLVHDVVITTGIFLIWGHREISLVAIAALLTIIGYSLNDTIVVFDRIRENIGLNPKDKLKHIVNASVNQTLSRTLLTSLTTLFVVVVLYIFGGSGINDFSAIMIAGIVLGTYSTIFIATPVMMIWAKYRKTLDEEPAEGGHAVAGAASPAKEPAKSAASETPA